MLEAARVEAFLADREAGVEGLRPWCAKRVDWAGAPGLRTKFSVVYVHGFTASAGEIDPVPGRVAAAVGANVHFTRLAGHGVTGPEALGAATLADWQADCAEALDVGRAIGERVVVISCSTGSTLVVPELARRAEGMALTLFVSPNFAVASRFNQRLLDMPGVRAWGLAITGLHRRVPEEAPGHGRWWTLYYKSRAVFAVADAIRAARAVDLGKITVPAGFFVHDGDRVISAPAARAAYEAWGGPKRWHAMGGGTSAWGHVVVGDVFGADQTERAVREMVAQIAAL